MRLKILISAVLLGLNFNTAEALQPVILTTDQTTKLDLTTDEAKSINLLDCQLHVEGQPPNYRLVHSKGELPIPSLAVKSIQDDVILEIAVQSKLAGLPVSRLLLYKHTQAQAAEVLKRTDPPNNYSFLIQGSKEKVARVLKLQFGKDKVVLPPSDDAEDSSVILLSKPDLLLFTGYGYALWEKKRKETQVDYECVP